MHWLWRSLLSCLAGGFVAIIVQAWWGGQFPCRALWLYNPGLFTTLLIIPSLGVCLTVYGVLSSQSIRNTIPDDETRCRKCGYILRGIPEPRCSECGERI